MVTLYVSPSCTSCRKAKKWLQDQQIPFVERNIYSNPLTIDEIKGILRMTDKGTEEIISTNSKIFKELNLDLEDLPLKDLYQIILKYPSILKRPILIDEKRLQVGFNEEEIRMFLPRKVRSYNLKEARNLLEA